MKFLSRAIGISFSFCLLALLAQSAGAQAVAINEIAWMGTKNSANDEWIELYNNTNSEINLSGWKLVAQDGTPEINLTGNITGSSFYLLERTNDDTLPGILASQIYTGALGNAGESLGLYDNAGNLVDSVNCSAGWFSGDNQTKQTMERVDSKQLGISHGNWQTSQNAGGTPKAKNSVATEINQPVEQPAETNIETASPTQAIEPEKSEPEVEPKNESASMPQAEKTNYPSGIIISEILPSPQGPDETEEWIELLNQNQFEVDLTGWQIKDSVGTITAFTIPSRTKIPASGFLVFSRPTTKIILNNEGDGVSLLQPDGKIVETINYPKAKLNQSWSKLGSEWFWTSHLTPGAKNIIPESVTTSAENESGNLSADKNGVPQSEKSLAAIGKQVVKKNSFILLIAFAIAALSGGIILILKRKLKIS